jgi:hypothetical protein
MCNECIKAVIRHPGLLEQYDRLRGTTFSSSGIEHMIDKDSGKLEEDAKELAQFIQKYIHEPVFGS